MNKSFLKYIIMMLMVFMANQSIFAAVGVSGFSPSSGCSGNTSVVITGTDFMGATSVTFGGTPALSFVVNNATQITAIVGNGTTGVVSVTTPLGNASSAGTFTVNLSPAVTITQSPANPVPCGGNALLTAVATGGGGGAPPAAGNRFYIRDYDPWWTSNNTVAMDAVFGGGNYTTIDFASANPAAIFVPGTQFVFLEGSDGNAYALDAYINANISTIENWVNAGGRLFLNSAPNQGGNMNWGFGGVVLDYSNGQSQVDVNPAHAIVSGPFTPAGAGPYYGSGYSHANIQNGGTDIITGGGVSVLTEKNWGNGLVLFGGITSPSYHSPSPNAQNLWQNIISYTATSAGAFPVYTYLWQPGGAATSTMNAATTGIYTVTVSAGSCSATSTVSVIMDPPPAAPTPVTATPASICVGSSSDLNAVAGNDINWYTVPSGGVAFATVPSGTNVPVTPAVTTTYYAERAGAPGAVPGSQTFNYTGSMQTFTVPAGVTSVTIDAYGAQGGGTEDACNGGILQLDGGLGGSATGTLAVTPGQVLNIFVGQMPPTSLGGGVSNGGYNGGGPSGQYGGPGGGASDVRVGGIALGDRVIVAGGGGGGNTGCSDQGEGGAGGGLTGNPGIAYGGYTPAGGGTQGAGGAAGSAPGAAGSLGIGGGSGQYHEGAGGGGYYGGGSAYAAGGGGGSSYIGGVGGGATTTGVQSGHGMVTISWAGGIGCPSSRVPVTVSVGTMLNTTITQSPANPVPCGGSALLTAVASGGATPPPAAGDRYYIRDYDPWWTPNNTDAMNAVFGGSYNTLDFASANPAAIFVPGTQFVFLEGSDGNAYALDAYINANISTIENWVNAGGRLFLNSAPNQGGNMNWGFGGVVLDYSNGQGQVDVNPAHPIVSGPFTPAGAGPYNGNGYSHANIQNGGTDIITGGGVSVLTEKNWGNGLVLFGGITSPSFHSPSPNAQNLWQNIISYTATSAGAAPAYTYLWQPGGAATSTMNAATTGIYTVTVSAGGCSTTSTVSVIMDPPPAAPTPVTATPASICVGSSSDLNAVAGNDINWYTVPSGGVAFATVPSGTNVPVTPAVTTTYYAERAGAPGAVPGSQTFNYTGSMQTFTVPAGVTSVTIDAYGAQGGGTEDACNGGILQLDGGLGGSATGTLAVTPGQVLNIFVGEMPATSLGGGVSNGGYNGGGPSGQYGGPGGGASDVRVGGIALGDRVIVAGGGGGGNTGCSDQGEGGAGGGLTGNPGIAYGGFTPAGGGTQGAGGAAGSAPGAAGSLGIGGGSGQYHEGAGGGGYYGGGSAYAAGGGGGSSYIGGVGGGATTTGVQSGHGMVTISWAGGIGCPSSRVPVTVSVGTMPNTTIIQSPSNPLPCGVIPTLTVGGGDKYYIRDYDPWGTPNNTNAMDAVYGAGNYTTSDFASANPATVFVPATQFVFLEGSDANANALNSYITANISTIENWVNAGGRLFLNSAPNQGGNMNWGFGGVVLDYNNAQGQVDVDPAHPIASGPFTPAGAGPYNGNSYSHAHILNGGTDIITGGGVSVLTEKVWGSGLVLFGGITSPNFHSPQPNAQNLWQNIINYCGGAVAGAQTYAWAPGGEVTPTINAPATGIYTVTVTQGACSSTNTISVTLNPDPVVVATATPSTTCNMTSVTPNATGANSYVWTGGLTNGVPFVAMATATYTVTGTNGAGCTATSTVTVTVNPASGILAPATTNQSQDHGDDFNINYYDGACDLIATVDDGTGGNILGLTTSTVNVDATAGFHNGQPFVRRWYQITPTSNGSADVILYINQSDFDDYNAVVVAPYLPLPTSGNNADPNVANIRITKNDDAGLGNNPIVITPTVNWNGTYWELSFNTPSFSQFRVHSVNPGGVPLPATVTNFSGMKLESSDKLSWTTASEQNNAYFNLQHSTDGVSFSTIAKVNSKAPNGNSTSTLNYSSVNNKPALGHNYYRLQQVDIDQKVSVHAQIVDLIWGANGSSVSIYPNPTTDILNVDLYTAKAANTTVKLLDMSGRVVKQIQAKSVIGMNNIQLSMGEIAGGLYTIQVYENNTLTHTSKVRKND